MSKLSDYINENVALSDAWFTVFGTRLPQGKFLCPNPEHLHTNNTPSCKVYNNGFKCFGQCGRMFGPYDLFKWYLPSKIEEIKSTIVLPDSPKEQKMNYRYQIDRTKSLYEIISYLQCMIR